jgi:phosphopantothenoylcysteine decarboxylase/phosphopantothenate--cysteine ligase
MNSSALYGKKILLGVTGSIAAYKSAVLVRELKKRGADVRVIMSKSAHDFITPLTLATLAEHRVYTDFTESKEQGTWNNHVSLGIWADLMIISPASANTISDMAQGKADSFLLATYLSARCKVALAPAMDLDMFAHDATSKNLEILSDRGHLIIGPEDGELASGLRGKGRMTEPEEIVNILEHYLLQHMPLIGKSILVTAGPTYEAIDPVRFIGNRSSGKMGFAIAEALAAKGANITLIAGPVTIQTAHPFIKRIDVESAEEMYRMCLANFDGADAVVMSAAVADYRPTNPYKEKFKKTEEHFSIDLVKNPDILAEMGKRKKPGQILVGFALETTNELEHALLKLERKNLNLIVLNSLKDQGAGFGVDTNQIKLIYSKEKISSFELKSKQEVAEDIANALTSLLIV